MASLARRGLLRVLRAVAFAAPLWIVGRGDADAGDAVARLIDALEGARSFKVRAHAATLLARLRDPRALPALMEATLHDAHPAVRAAAVRLLARVARGETAAAQQVRPVIGRALGDRDPVVRRQAGAALAELERSFAPPPTRAVPRPPAG